MKKDSIAYVVGFTFVTTAVFVLGLAAANETTKPLVEANRKFASQSAVLDAFGIPYEGREGAEAAYAKSVVAIEGASPPAWRTESGGETHYAVEASGPGLWGTITVILAADAEAGRVDGLRVLSQNETPGLGGRIDEAWFLGQFKGERAEGGAIRIASGAESGGAGDSDDEDARVDGITGATRTTQSMEALVKAALGRVREVAGGTK